MSTKLATAFLERIQRSGLVPPDEMPRLRQRLEERGVDLANAAAIAEYLVELEAVTRWQADKLLEGKHKGFFLGSYRLLRPLGKGGMGAVFLATHEMMRRQCAIKVLPHSQIKEGSSVLKRFYIEAQAVAALDHQNIVRAYDVNKETKDGKDIHYLVMEYVEGQDVQALVQDQGLMDYIRAAEYLRQTANGLTHAHENGLVHRDIKPANLLVDKKGVVKILDLGLARFFDDTEAASLTAAHNETVLGTADYLSPEQALNSHAVDHRTDIYSLGCTAYFMLTGHPPFPEGSVAQRLIAHQVRMPSPITDERPDAPADLLAIIDKMMAKNPADRYQTAEELSAVLAKWLIEHGDAEWKRQHSEIVADKALISLLASREPTRAISSSMSETELELAPLDDEDADHVMTAPAKPASPPAAADSARRVASDSARRAAASDSARQPAAGSRDSGSGRREAGSGSRKTGSGAGRRQRSDSSRPAAPRPAAAPPPPAPEPPMQEPELESLEHHDMFGHDPLEPLGGVDLGQLHEADMLGQLNQLDLGGPGLGPAPGTAMDSGVRRATLSGGHPTVSGNQRNQAASAAGLGWFGANTIGWPILIGGAGGLLVVLIILAIIFLSERSAHRAEPSSPPADSQSIRTPSAPLEVAEDSPQVPGDSSQAEPPAGAAQIRRQGPAGDSPPGEQVAEAGRGGTPPGGQLLPPHEQEPPPAEPQRTEYAPAGADQMQVQTPAEAPAADTFPPTADVAPAEEMARSPAAAETPPAAAAQPEPSALAQEALSEQATGRSGEPSRATKTQEAEVAEPEQTEEPVIRQSPEELLAGLEAVRLEGKAPAVGRASRELSQLLSAVGAAINRNVLQTLDSCGIKPDEAAKAVLAVELGLAPEGQLFVMHMRGRLTAPDAAGEMVELWAHEEELARLAPQFNYVTALSLSRDGVTRFFQNLRTRCREVQRP